MHKNTYEVTMFSAFLKIRPPDL